MRLHRSRRKAFQTPCGISAPQSPLGIPAQPVTPHPPYGRKGRRTEHNNGSQKTAGGVASVRAGGQPIVVTGNSDTCGHPRVGGSGDVRVG